MPQSNTASLDSKLLTWQLQKVYRIADTDGLGNNVYLAKNTVFPKSYTKGGADFFTC